MLEERVGIEMTEDIFGFLAAYFGVFLLEHNRKETMQDRDRQDLGKIIGRLDRESVKESDVEPEFEISMVIFDEKSQKMIDYIVTTTELHTDTKTPVIFRMDEVFDREYAFNVNLKII